MPGRRSATPTRAFQHARRKHSRRHGHSVGQRILIALGTLVGVLVASVAVYAIAIAGIFSAGTQSIVEAFPDETNRPAPVEDDAAAAQNILLPGSDTRGAVEEDIDDIEGQLSDVIMVLHISADRQNMQVMSIPRDSWVDIPGFGMNKINAALALGGVSLTVQTIESLIDVRIDRVAIVDFEGFRGITEALGGVTVENEMSFTSSDGYQYPEGPNGLIGERALSFVRERMAFPDGDFQRARNQQAFLRAVMAETLTAETLTNPGTVAGLVSAVAPNLTVDDGFTPAFVAGLAVELRDVRVDDVTFFTIATTGTGTVAGQSVVFLDEEELPALQRAFRSDAVDRYTPPEPEDEA